MPQQPSILKAQVFQRVEGLKEGLPKLTEVGRIMTQHPQKAIILHALSPEP